MDDFTYYLDIVQKVFSVIGSLSIIVALVGYLYKKRQDKSEAAISQISFFREKVIIEASLLIKKIKQENPDFIISRIDFSEYKNIEDLRDNKSINFARQLAVFVKNSDSKVIDWVTKDNIIEDQIFLLNTLVEFCLRVINTKNEKSPALCDIRYAFVEIVEQNAVCIFYLRDIALGNKVFSPIISLYKEWNKDLEKIDSIANYKKHGFINKKEKEELMNKKKKIFI